MEGAEPWLSIEATQYVDIRDGKLPPDDFYQHLSTIVKPYPGPSDAPDTGEESVLLNIASIGTPPTATAIIEIYENLDASKKALTADFEKARQIRLLLNIGRQEFGTGASSIFFPLAKQKTAPGSLIRILYTSPQSPFLSEARAARRSDAMTKHDWQTDIGRLEKHIALLKNVHNIDIDARVHYEPFIWRLFLFDDIGYINSYTVRNKGSVVAKFSLTHMSPFQSFDRYFEYLWWKGDPDDTQDTDIIEKWKNW